MHAAQYKEDKHECSRAIVLPDIQALPDARNIRIDGVGVKGVRYPVSIRSGGSVMPTIATFSMSVGLSPSVKGTHMSRFIEMLEAQSEALDQSGFMTMVTNMLDRLDAYSGVVEMRFPYFVKKPRRFLRCKACLT